MDSFGEDWRLHSIQVGQIRALAQTDKIVRTAIRKEPVAGPVHLGFLGLQGDEQANRKYHGGPDQAVLWYAANHYPAWQKELGQELPYGSFGENLTIAGPTEDQVCLLDVYRVGAVVLEVTAPREPCNRLAQHLGQRGLVKRVRDSGRTGFYCRVLVDGPVAAGAPVVLQARPLPEFTVRRAALCVHGSLEEMLLVRSCQGLAERFAATLDRHILGIVKETP